MTTTSGGGDSALHQIHFGYRQNNLLGQGFGPSATSLREADDGYQRLTHWCTRLNEVADPAFAPGEAESGYWYRWYDDGQGALLYRVPQALGRDGRGDTARALVGRTVTPSPALVFAARGWSGEPSAPIGSWGALRPVPALTRDDVGPDKAALTDDALRSAGLLTLVTAVLADPFTPVDVLTTFGGRVMGQRERLALLWGVYQALHGILGRAREPRFQGVDWSFSTHEPWPARSGDHPERPRIAFRPPPTGVRAGDARVVDLSAPAEHDQRHRAVARWLIGRLGTATEVLDGDGWSRIRAYGDGADAYAALIHLLHDRADREGAGASSRGWTGATRRVGAAAPPAPPGGGKPASRSREDPTGRTLPDRADEEATEELPPRRDAAERTAEEPAPGGAADRTGGPPPGTAEDEGVDPQLVLLMRMIANARENEVLEKAVNAVVHRLNPGFMGEMVVESDTRYRRFSLTTTRAFLAVAGAALVLFLVCVVLLTLLVS
ncbi:hypothetical protein KIK06_05995 [Nocardiopsis sp. EMB25]|uniref:hypothetical protein n=1 Tax=Nocardiopsis sp. EMB25 TaxID=2835867 RepID=UPI002283E9DA|nr:hypothetical protein [Nocardiopsis sp. EMB25]MCY9783447.1 hypothetical protein [Nocardiopsis sp. EMB25]